MKNIAILVEKILSFLLRLIHRGGSLPGRFALKLYNNVLQKLDIQCPVILVTGTNGKTSTCNLIASSLENAGKTVITNRRGDNMREGIATSVLNAATLSGVVHADYIVLEVDELNVRYIMKDLPVSHIVVTNFFRDQLDRAREMEQLIQKIEGAIRSFKGTLILNANDPNVVRLHHSAKKANAVYYGMNKCSTSFTENKEASEGKFCPICGGKLVYDFYQYSHIGVYRCINKDFYTPKNRMCGDVIDVSKRLFNLNDMEFKAPQDGLYTMYNCMAVLCTLTNLGIDLNYAKKTFETIEVPGGRNETLMIKDRTCVLNLIKNPTGANEVLKVIEEDNDPKTVLLVLNDHAQDGKDISWIYDTFFEKLISDSTNHVICSGDRCYDMALRLKYGGYVDRIEVEEELDKAVESLVESNTKMYAIATYTALQPVRKLLRRKA